MQLQLFDKRWQHQRERWVRPGEIFSPAGFAVDVVAERDARAIVAEHHYAHSFPAARLSVGLLRKPGPCAPAEVVGVAVFSVPMSPQVISNHAGVPPAHGVELGRFVCTPVVAYNGETWFLRRAFAALRAAKPEVRAIVSWSDPLERRTPEGHLTKPAHYGTIYQGSNAAFVGRAAARLVWVTRFGAVVSARALSKIRTEDRGHAYAARQLIEAGAPQRVPGESPADWLDRALRPSLFRQLRHPGNFAYVFALDREALSIAKARALPYPKRPRSTPAREQQPCARI